MLTGVVILYNPDDTVIQNINSYIGYLQKLYVVDNSELYNQTVIEYLKSNTNITYINNNNNLGVAKALNIAADAAIADGFKWLLTMDQDSFILKGFFDIAAKPLANPTNIIVAASYNNSFFKKQESVYDGFVELGAIITSGNLLNLEGWRTIGKFCEKLFIDEVDNDFCARAIKNGYKIIATEDVYLAHNLGTVYNKTNIISGKKLSLTKHSPLRVYYMTRNNLYLWKHHMATNPALIYNRMKNMAKLTYEITFYYPSKLSYYKSIVKGAFHFLISKYGKQ
jgi:rhamnosyltransferase